MKHFNFPTKKEQNFQTNIKDIVMGIKDPTELFFLNLEKNELKKIREDPKYYIQDEKYLNGVKYLKNMKLCDRVEEEEKLREIEIHFDTDKTLLTNIES